MHCFSNYCVNTMDPKVSPVNEKTDFYNEKTEFECIFREVYFEDNYQVLELYPKSIDFVLMSSLFYCVR